MAEKINKGIITSWILLPPPVGITKINKTSPNEIFSNVFLTNVGVPGSTYEYNFLNKTVVYNSTSICQNFDYALVDNRGTGAIRICYNMLGLNMSTPVNGAKTIGAGESFYIEEDVSSLGIYFEDNSIVEIILKSNTGNV